MNNNLIAAKEYCTNYNLEFSFISWLHEHELLQVTIIEEEPYFPDYQLKELEHYITLHHDLEINLEGIEAITHLMDRVNIMQAELKILRNKVSMYEKFMDR